MKVITDEKKIDELLSRGVEEVIEKEHLRKALLSGKQLRVKLGIDPTSSDLHLGHGVVLRKLKAFQDLGHKAVLVIGDFTASIGDPTGRVKARPALSAVEIKKNMKGYLKQAGKVIDVKRAEIKYNNKWLSKMKLSKMIEFSSLLGIGEVLQREDFRKRMEGIEAPRVNEILYSIMQGIDSVQLKVDVELGGNDQLLNNMMGRTLMGKLGMESQDVLTTQLLEGTDGTEKMSKSLGNYIGLNDSADEMYGKLMSIKDELIEKYLWLCTDLDKDSISGILEADGNPKNQKAWLAFEVVALYHGREAAGKAQTEFGKVFSEGETPSEVAVIKIEKNHVTLLDLVMQVDGIKSKSEARRIIGQGGVKVNGHQLMDGNRPIALESEVLVQVGKRRFAKFIKERV